MLLSFFVGGAVPIQLVTLSFGYAQYIDGVVRGPKLFMTAYEFAKLYIPLVYIPAMAALIIVTLYCRHYYPDIFRRIVMGFKKRNIQEAVLV